MSDFRISETGGMNNMSGDDILGGGQPDPAPVRAPPPVEEIANAEDIINQNESMGDSEMHGEEEANENPELVADNEQPESGDGSEVEIRAFKQDHKFKLDPKDELLRKTLSLGVAAPKWKQKLSEVTDELSALKKDSGHHKERAQVWDELRDLRDNGHYEEVARMVLDDKFDEFRDAILNEYTVGQSGSEAERYELERSRTSRAQKYREEQSRKEIERLRTDLEGREDATREQTMRSTGEAVLRKYDMSQYVDDADEAQELNEMLWEMSWADVNRKFGEGDELPSSLEIQRAFARRAKLLRGGRSRAVENQVQQVTDTKREEARTAAKAAATKNYPSTAAKDIDKLKSARSARELFGLL